MVAVGAYVVGFVPYRRLLRRLRVVVDAWDQIDGNRPNRRLGVHALGYQVLQPDGSFLVYQFTRAVLPYLRETFPLVDQKFEPRNIMPARLFYCRRSPAARAGNGRREPRPRARTASDHQR